ncbi:MAG: HD-GYP domain-containing protein [Candidatus Zipacnadales bacterium]
MKFHELSRAARMLVVGMCLAGAVGLVSCILLPPPRDFRSATVYLVLAFLAAGWRVKIHPKVASISPGFIVVFAAQFRCGTLTAVGAAVINSLAVAVLRQNSEERQPLWATMYNASSLGLTALLMGAAHDHVIDAARAKGFSMPDLMGALVATAIYYTGTVVAMGLVATVHHLELPARRWWWELVGIAPVYIAGAAIAFALDSATKLLIVGLPLAYLIQRFNAIQAQRLTEEVERRRASEQTAGLYLSVVETLSNAIDMKDHGTHTHVQRVHALAKAIGERMGLKGADLEAVKIGAVLHDIGKLAVPDRILRKPDRLTLAEFRLIKEHPGAGEAILRPIDFGVPVGSIIRHHHEKLDGSGYPDGLKGDEISLGARVLAVIDIYDALVSDRPYRKAWTRENALAQLRREAGTKLDARVVETLASVLESGEVDAHMVVDAASQEAIRTREALVELEKSEAVFMERVAEAARRYVLQGLIDHLDEQAPLLAAVAYTWQEKSSEIDALVVVGECGRGFHQARIPIDEGVSARAAQTGRLVSGWAADDLQGLSEGVPNVLRDAQVRAIPVVGKGGKVLAVVSLYYSACHNTFLDKMEDDILRLIELAGQQLESIARLTPLPASSSNFVDLEVVLGLESAVESL